jgi:hypothetical protein
LGNSVESLEMLTSFKWKPLGGSLMDIEDYLALQTLSRLQNNKRIEYDPEAKYGP